MNPSYWLPIKTIQEGSTQEVNVLCCLGPTGNAGRLRFVKTINNKSYEEMSFPKGLY